jgi:uncharacterized RDD family membrane protein YckC
MANLQINTTQNVNLGYTVVSIGERILAIAIDLVIFVLYLYIIDIVTSVISEFTTDNWTIFGFESLMLLPLMFYSLIMHILFNGRTVGKMVVKTRVVRLDGSPVHWSNYLVRWMLRLVELWFFPAVGLISVILSDKGQSIGDAAAGTVVISTKQRVTISNTILEEISDDYTPVFSTVTNLTDKDARLIKETFQIAVKSGDFKTLNALRVKVESLLGTQSDYYDKQYIDVVLKDYNFYTQRL